MLIGSGFHWRLDSAESSQRWEVGVRRSFESRQGGAEDSQFA